MATLSKIDRHHRILEVLSANNRALLPDLENQISASRITIQRDLAELEERGLIRRFHGGAMLTEYEIGSESHTRRMAINRGQKRRLSTAAAAHISRNSFVGVDPSSTMYYLSEQSLPHGVTIVTSGLDTFVNLMAKQSAGVQAIVTGGRLQPETQTLVGPDAIRTIESYHYEVFLFSAYSVITGAGVFEYNEENAAVKRAFAGRADRRILVLDKTKLAHRGGVKICELDEIDVLIIDGKPSDELQHSLGERLVVI